MTEAKVLKLTVELNPGTGETKVKLGEGWTGRFIRAVPAAITREYHRSKRDERREAKEPVNE